MNNLELWQAALGELELQVSKASFTTWFKDTSIAEYVNNSIIINVPNAFTKEWFEKKYHHLIIQTLSRLAQSEISSITYKIISKAPAEHTNSTPALETHTSVIQPTPLLNRHGLNPRYSFSTFIVGKSNELAHAAAKAVAHQPGVAYNPLFIYGGVGLGKTHLMQAIGHVILDKDANRRMLYTSCEKFTNDFVQAIKSGQTARFQNHYRNVDILLIDDIQFMGGKEQTQEQFFHTFNALHQLDKQIVITSDRPPKAIPGLENRLQSRFEWGMIADVGMPDLETRIAIIEAKLSEKRYKLPSEIISYIASQIQSNIRELEGVINHIIAKHQLNNIEPTFDNTKEIIQNLTSQTSRGALTTKHVLTVVAEFFDINQQELLGVSRKKNLVVPRQIAMYLMRDELKYSFPTIGQELGGRDHTTAIHSYEKIKREMSTSEKLRQDISLLKNLLLGNTA